MRIYTYYISYDHFLILRTVLSIHLLFT